MNIHLPLSRNRNATSRNAGGFTVVELLVVIAVAVLLATTLLPALARARPDGQSFQCMNNQRQLMVAWQMYSEDNNDLMPPNDFNFNITPATKNWVAGSMSVSSDSINPATLTDSKHSMLASYITSASVYKCPADRTVDPTTRKDKVRSVSMNSAVGTRWYTAGKDGGPATGPVGSPVGGEWLPGNYTPSQTAWLTYGKISQITRPRPANLWVLMEEHPASINDATLAVQCGLTGASARMIDFPASFHNGACGIAFADSHAEIHKWLDARTKPSIGDLFSLGVAQPNNPDIAWLQARTSAPR